MRRHRRTFLARLATVALLAPSLSAIGIGAATQAQATTPSWLTEANYLRTFWNVSVPTLTEDTTLDANDQAHDHYLDETQTCGHTEDTSSPYYSAAGAYGGSHSVVFCAALGPVNDVDGWAGTPLHGEQVLNPQLTVTGFAETSLNGGHAAMDTLTHYSDGAAPTVPATWPNGTNFPFTHFYGGEIDYTGGDAVLDNCGSTYAADEADLGAPIFVDLPGSAHNAVATAGNYYLKDSSGTSLPVCSFDATSPVAPFMSTAVMLPLHAFDPDTHYTASYTAGGQTGTWSFTTAARPPAAPPDVQVASSGNRSAVLTWPAPTDNGGSPITGYHVQQYVGGTWVDSTDTADSSSATTTKVTGLTNGTGYYFQVAAINAKGTGDYTISDTAAFPEPSVPDPPTGVHGVAGDGQVTVSWTAPADNGGAAIKGYDIEFSSNGGTSWTAASSGADTSTAPTGVVPTLTNGTPYVFRVAAINVHGTGSYSPASSAVTPVGSSATVPGKPTNVTGDPGDGQVTVSWTKPTSNGGSPLTGYNVQYSSNGGSTWTEASLAFHLDTATTQTVDGLIDGTSYVFRAAAINQVGTGSFSSQSSPVTPTSTPATDPSALTAPLSIATATYGDRLATSGVLTDATTSEPIANAQVYLMHRPAGTSDPWSVAAGPFVTSTAGAISGSVVARHNADCEWAYAGDSTHLAVASPVSTLMTAAKVVAAVKDVTVKKGHKIVMTGRLAPPGVPGRVTLQILKAGAWVGTHHSATIDNTSHYTLKFKAKKKGKFSYRVERAATSTNAAGESKTLHVKVS